MDLFLCSTCTSFIRLTRLLNIIRSVHVHYVADRITLLGTSELYNSSFLSSIINGNLITYFIPSYNCSPLQSTTIQPDTTFVSKTVTTIRSAVNEMFVISTESVILMLTSIKLYIE